MNSYDHYFPFARLGLSTNPFRRLTDDEWADIAVIPQPIEVAFDRGDNLLILGARGRGKSTTLRHLIRRIEWQGKQAAYERLPDGTGCYQTDIDTLDAFALDEAQRLSLRNWIPLLQRVRNGMRLMMGSHRHDKWLFQLAGIPISVFYLHKLSNHEHLASVLQRRIEYFSTGETQIHFAPSAIAYLWRHYRDNLRAIEAHLYDVFQKLEQPTTITDVDLFSSHRF
jgi:hypothetical protein